MKKLKKKINVNFLRYENYFIEENQCKYSLYINFYLLTKTVPAKIVLRELQWNQTIIDFSILLRTCIVIFIYRGKRYRQFEVCDVQKRRI